MDIRKCYESIDRDKLMDFLARHIKNDALLWLIRTLIGTFDKGLSIGSYLSQHLCNLYLSQIYHRIKEEMFRIRKHKDGSKERINLVKRALFYMDDILILGANAKDLHKAVRQIVTCAEELGLTIKEDWIVFKAAEDKTSGEFIDIMGTRIYREHTTIRRRVFIRIRRAFVRADRKIRKGRMTVKFARRCASYHGILKNTDSYKIRAKYKTDKIIKICKEVISNETKGTVCKAAACC